MKVKKYPILLAMILSTSVNAISVDYFYGNMQTYNITNAENQSIKINVANSDNKIFRLRALLQFDVAPYGTTGMRDETICTGSEVTIPSGGGGGINPGASSSVCLGGEWITRTVAYAEFSHAVTGVLRCIRGEYYYDNFEEIRIEPYEYGRKTVAISFDSDISGNRCNTFQLDISRSNGTIVNGKFEFELLEVI